MRKNQRKKNDNKKSLLTVREHIQELRARIILSLLILFVSSCIAYAYNQQIITFIIKPLGTSLVYLSPTAGIELTLNVSIYTGILLSLPFISYQFFAFILPAVEKSNWYGIRIIFISSLLTILGVAFGLFVALPASLRFLLQFGAENAQTLISSVEYISFVKLYTLGFAIVFQFPLIIIMLSQFFQLNVLSMLKFEFYLLPIAFLIAGIITPTFDIVNQTLIALPVVVLYQLTIIFVWINSKRYWIKK